MKVLVAAIVRCMEPWRPPQPLKVVALKHISPNPWFADLSTFVMCCDAAMDGVQYRAGAYIARTFVLLGHHHEAHFQGFLDF